MSSVTNPFAAGQSYTVSIDNPKWFWLTPLTRIIVGTKKQRIRPRRSPVVAVARLRIPGCTAEDEIGVVEEEMAETVIMAIHHETLMLLDYADKWRKVGVVF